MTNDRSSRRTKLREELVELRNAAIARLEHRGYAVRGKTPAQIRQLFKQRPSKEEIHTVNLENPITIVKRLQKSAAAAPSRRRPV